MRITLNRWFFLFLGLLVSLALLVSIPDENIVFRSLSVTFVATISICYYLYKRYAGRWSLQADLLVSLNTLLQFILPAFYLVFYYQSFPYLDRGDFRFGLAVTSFAAFLGQSMFFLGYETVRSAMYFPVVKIRSLSLIDFFVIIPILTGIWISRAILLASGSYYHIYRSEFQFTCPWYSILAQISEFGVIVMTMVFLIAFSEDRESAKAKKYGIAIATLGVELLWYLPAGSRQCLIMTAAAVLGAFIFTKKKIPTLMLVVTLLIGIPMFAIYENYKYAVAGFTGTNQIDLGTLLPALIESKEGLMQQSELDITAKTVARYDGEALNYLLMHYAKDYDYEYGGKTLKKLLFVFIPRFLYPDKPGMTIALDDWYFQVVAGGSSPVTFLGESYINFSWCGIIVMPFLLGLMMKGYDSLFEKRISNLYWIGLYGYGAIYTMLKLPMHIFAIWVETFFHVIVIAFVLASLQKFLIKNKIE